MLEVADFDFETQLKTLEKLVQTMESGDLSLDESMKNFEQGIHIVRQCQESLNKAEQKISQLQQFNPSSKQPKS